MTSAPKSTGEGSFVRFLTDLEAFFAFDPNLNDEQRLRFLPLCLVGVARDAFDSLADSQRTTYKEAVEGLKGFFHRPSSVDAHAQLRALKFEYRQSNSLDVFMIKFKKLVHEAFPGSVSDVVLFNCFLDAVPERYKVDIVSQGVTTFAGAVDRTRNVLRGEQLCRDRTPGDSSVRQLTSDEPSALQQILNRLEQLERRVAGVDDANANRSHFGRGSAHRGRGAGGRRGGSASAPSAAPRACFACGSFSHSRNECRFRNHSCFQCGDVGHLRSQCPGPATGSGNDRRGPAPGS